MLHRIEVGSRPDQRDPRGEAVVRDAGRFLGLTIDAVHTRSAYRIAAELSDAELERLREALTDPVLERSASPLLPLDPGFDWVIQIGYLPGVTDNLGRTARVFIRDLLGETRAVDVHTETLYALRGRGLVRPHLERIGSELIANPVVHSVRCYSAAEYAAADHRTAPPAGETARPIAEPIALPPDDDALSRLSGARSLALSLAEMRAIRDHFAAPEVRAQRSTRGLPAEPTDVELEALAQTWSEHCKHKIFNALIDYTDERGQRRRIDSLFRSTIVAATRRIAADVDWLVSVFDDNAGVVRVADDLCLVFKVETHNSPSALDPYGGAITGIVGVNRDPFGTGIGAQLLTNTWGYCLAPPDTPRPPPRGLLPPRRVRDGVHAGVIDGGNQSGIPYSRGFEIFDDRFLGKPLVFCGTVGVMPTEIAGRPTAKKEIRAGDVVVMVGGRIGKDGIHGATFSSEALHGSSPVQAVQIGDPITQKMTTDMLLEARDRGLYRTLTDNGAGGLSSSVGELAELSGGAELDLDLAPLKYPGLQPWEILLSEAQERMTLAVPPESLDELLALAGRREVEATAIGRFTDDGSFRLRYGGRVVGELPLSFLHGGCPRLELSARWEPPVEAAPAAERLAEAAENPVRFLLDILQDLDFCSKEDRARRYDHEVKGLSVVKPLVGVHGDVAADATAMRICHGRDEAVLLAEGIAPQLSDLDAGAMASWVVDLAVRRILCGGGQLGKIAGLDNFCWPDPVQSPATPDGEQKLAALVRCCEALREATVAFGVPLISGKDSMKNDAMLDGVKISIPPTLLFSAMGWIDSAGSAMDLVIPRGPHALFLLGATRPELGASALYRAIGRERGEVLLGQGVPRVDLAASRETCRALQEGCASGLVVAAHAPHRGGLALGLATLCLAADRGLAIDLGQVPTAGGARQQALSPLELLYSESGGRVLAVVPTARAGALERLLEAQRAPWARIGSTTSERRLSVHAAGTAYLVAELDELRRSYRGREDATEPPNAPGAGDER